jgi:hypothetical protein
MKKTIAVVAAGLLLVVAAGTADARGGGGGGRGGHGGFHGGRPGHFQGHHFRGHGFRGSVFIGGYWGPYWDPYWYPGYYPYYPYPYEAAPVSIEPQTYIEQSGPTYWYYCEGAKAYYPYVRECPGGWLTVTPPPQGAPEPKP